MVMHGVFYLKMQLHPSPCGQISAARASHYPIQRGTTCSNIRSIFHLTLAQAVPLTSATMGSSNATEQIVVNGMATPAPPSPLIRRNLVRIRFRSLTGSY